MATRLLTKIKSKSYTNQKQLANFSNSKSHQSILWLSTQLCFAAKQITSHLNVLTPLCRSEVSSLLQKPSIPLKKFFDIRKFQPRKHTDKTVKSRYLQLNRILFLDLNL